MSWQGQSTYVNKISLQWSKCCKNYYDYSTILVLRIEFGVSPQLLTDVRNLALNLRDKLG